MGILSKTLKKVMTAVLSFEIICTMVFGIACVDVKADVIEDAMNTSTEAVEKVDQITNDVDQSVEQVVTPNPDETETPEESVTPEEPENKDIRYIVVDRVKVRKSAKTKSKGIGYLTWKTPVIILQKKNKTWSKIECDGMVGYIKNKYLKATEPVVTYAEEAYIRYAKKKTKIYKAPSGYAAKSGSYKKNATITCIGTCGSFTVIKKGEKELFVKTSYLKTTKSKKKTSTGSGKGASVAKYALKFKGNPYKYGGTSLTHGADCSGFTMSVFKHFGIKLPHSSSAQRKYGKAVSLKNAKAGDLVCYSGHVGIYIGGGKIIHASTPKGGIKVSSVHIMKIKTIRRLV